ncbi:MAG: hypothetical protein JNJ82_12890 [Opitutaceae bacterium]|nr:hypothetical protein [Opitutaceae bacterium]
MPSAVPRRLVVVGERGLILTSADAGETWTRCESGTTAGLTSVAYSDAARRFVAVGEGGTILSSSDGVTWARETSPTPLRLNAVIEAGPGIFRAVGEAGVGLLERSNDGLDRWVRSDVGFGVRSLRGFVRHLVVGDDGGVFIPGTPTGDSSTTTPWSLVPVPTGADLDAAALSPVPSIGNTTSILAVGAAGTILELSPRTGGNFVQRVSGTTERLRGVCFKGGGTLTTITLVARVTLGERFVVGDAGTLLRSTDGKDWLRDTVPTVNNLNGITTDETFVYIVGDRGTLLKGGGITQAPMILSQPTTGYTSSGDPYVEALASGPGALTYFWVQLNGGAPYPIGSDGPRLVTPNNLFPRAGPPLYQLYVANGFSMVASATTSPQRFLNLSARAAVGSGDNTLIGGFTVASTLPAEQRTLLIRAVGPTLAQFGVTNTLAAPRLSVFSGSQVIATNTGWSGQSNAAAIADAARQVAAFPLASNSADCALLLSLAAGNYTAQVESVGGATGTALVEVYDIGAPTLSRLANVSTRSLVNPSAAELISGFVISGGLRKTVLLRAAGPALAGFGLTSALAHPRLTLFRGSTVVASAGAWSQSANPNALSEAARTIGAFEFPANSADVALLIELEPGAYTIQVTSADGGSGVALAEVYELF